MVISTLGNQQFFDLKIGTANWIPYIINLI